MSNFSLILFTVPPRKIEIVGISPGSRLKIKENEIVELKCIVQEAKPKAHIVWFRENSEFVTGKNTLLVCFTQPCLNVH